MRKCQLLRVALVVVVLLLASGCEQKRPADNVSAPGASTTSSASGTTGDLFDLKNHPGATIIHPLDPHTLTPSQIKFGISPRRDPSVEYQPDIILMENGDKAIKSVAGDGLTWTFDANAPHVSYAKDARATSPL